MKNFLHFILFLFAIGVSNAQTPVHLFNFENNLQNTANSLNLAGANLTYEAGRNAAAGQAVVINNNNASVNSYIDAAVTGLPTNGGAFTVCFWAKFNTNAQSGNENRLLSIGTKTTTSGVNGGLSFWSDVNLQNTERFFVNYGSASFGADFWSSTPLGGVSQGWNFYAFTYSGSGITRVYKNAVLQSATSETLVTLANQILKMGRWNDSVFDNFPRGSFSVDELQLFNSQLNIMQITSIYTPAQIPTISAVSSSMLGTTTASINYSINAGGASTTPVIKYGLSSTNLNLTQNGAAVIGSTVTPQIQGLAGLSPNTTYFYRVEASNSAGNAVPSSTLSFTTLPATTAPLISNLTTASVVPSFESAQVNFNLNAFGSTTTYVVEYSTDVIAQFWSVASGGTTSVNSSTPFTVQISGLNSNIQYFVRVKATNAANQVTTSNVVSFTTLNPIVVTNLGTSNITATTAQINYTLNTNGINTFIEIRYQASSVFDSDNPFTTIVVNNFNANTTTATNLNYVLTGLTPNTLYSYQFGAITNNNGFFQGGQNAAFTTTAAQSVTPTATTPQTFCNGATVANLVAAGTDLKWYANATGGSQLASTTLLTPTTYYVTQTQPNLTESARLAVGVNITVVNAPTASAQSFCNSATVANLVATGTGNIAWFNVATGGTALASTTALATGTYYVSQTIGSCTSTRTAVAVTVGSAAAPTASAQSFCNSATVANLLATGTGTIAWFNVATGGTALASTTALATGTYYVSQTIGSCTSTRTSVAVTVGSAAAPTASAQSFCNSATVANLVATGTGTIAWFNVATGGTALASTTALASGTYYVSQTIGSCTSTRTAVSVTLNIVNAPPIQNQTFCQSATVANLTPNGTQFKWYATLTGGTQLANTTALVSGTYYVSQTINNCESSRTAVLVTINVVLPPTAQAQNFCFLPTVANLVANGTNLKWYTMPIGSPPLAATATLESGTYYVSQTVGTCESTRTAVDVTVGSAAAPTASAQSFCNSATVANLVATGTGTIAWFNVATGGTALASTTALATGTYYVSQTIGSCTSTRTAVAVTVGSAAAPTASAQSFCNSATVANLAATGTGTIAWFNVATGGTALASTTALATGTYFVQQTIGSCTSTRTSVAVTVGSAAAPTGNATQTFVQGATVANLSATGTGTIAWFASAANAIANTNVLVSSILLENNTTYFAVQTVGTCRSSSLAVNVIITSPLPTAPSPQNFCNGTGATIVNLSASGSVLRFYATNTSTAILPLNTPLVQGTYYVTQTLSGLAESTRLPIVVNITTVTAPTAQAQSFCNSATIGQLTASGTNLKWYDDITGGTQLPNSLTFVQTNTFYVSQTVGTCESARTPVLATVNVVNAPTGNANQTFIQGATISNLAASGTGVVWFATQSDAVANINPILPTALLVTNTTYYAMQTINDCRSTSSLAVTVTVTLSSNEANKLIFFMYPNPVIDKLTIEMENELDSVELYSLQGQKMYTSFSKVIILDNLPIGMYLVKVTDINGLTTTKKVVKK